MTVLLCLFQQSNLYFSLKLQFCTCISNAVFENSVARRTCRKKWCTHSTPFVFFFWQKLSAIIKLSHQSTWFTWLNYFDPPSITVRVNSSLLSFYLHTDSTQYIHSVTQSQVSHTALNKPILLSPKLGHKKLTSVKEITIAKTDTCKKCQNTNII